MWHLCFPANVCISSPWNRVASVFCPFFYFMSNTNIGKQSRYLWHSFLHVLNPILEESCLTMSNLLFLKQALNYSREV